MKKFKTALLLVVTLIFATIAPACINIIPGSSSTSDAKVLNGVTTEKITEINFSVILDSELAKPGKKSEKHRAQGSGVIFDYKTVPATFDEEGYYIYYLLTNNHVVYQNTEKYNSFEYFVVDCYGSQKPATVLAKDPNYDLAVMTFKSERLYKTVDFATENPLTGAKVIALGQPLGIVNSVTAGKVLNYTTVKVTNDNSKPISNQSNVAFSVIKHNAPINNGSSGGVLLNYNYQICGINYAAELDENGGFETAYAVPVLKVKEFLIANGILEPPIETETE